MKFGYIRGVHYVHWKSWCFTFRKIRGSPNIGASLAKGVLGSLTGFTRWHKQYSDLRFVWLEPRFQDRLWVMLPLYSIVMYCNVLYVFSFSILFGSTTNCFSDTLRCANLEISWWTPVLGCHTSDSRKVPACSSFVFTHLVIWLILSGVMSESSPICTMASWRHAEKSCSEHLKRLWTYAKMRFQYQNWVKIDEFWRMKRSVKIWKKSLEVSWPGLQIWIMSWHVFFCCMAAFLMVATASLTSATSLGSSKMPQIVSEMENKWWLSTVGASPNSNLFFLKSWLIGFVSWDTAWYLAVAATQTQHQVQSGLLLDVVVRQRPAILQLLAGEDQTLP